MPFRQVKVGSPQVQALYDRFLEKVRSLLDDPKLDRNVVCRDILTEIHHGSRTYDELLNDETLPLATRVAVSCYDPRNVSVEPEYYYDCDGDRFERTKPLIWLWMMFDRSPLARNMHLGIPFRRMLAERVFKKCGKNMKIFHDVEVSYGYGIEAGDDCVVHRGVLLDDRGGISLGNRVSISDWANVYSHTHDIHDIENIAMLPTKIGHGARITYHSTVLAGVTVGDDAMVGAMALANKNVEPHHVKGGIPAKTIRVKDRKSHPKGGPEGCC
jgi:acetyltransferase-like isoleucine patch superfamily enzyme